MPYTLDWEPKGVYKRFHGQVSFAEYARSVGETLGDERTDSLRYIINDLTGIEGYSVTAWEAEEVSAMSVGAARSNPRLRLAFVTKNPALRALIVAALAVSRFEAKTFTNLDDARAWCAVTR